MTDTTRRIRGPVQCLDRRLLVGPGGTEADTWLYEHAGQGSTAIHLEGNWRGCSSALVGRTNYVGFHSVWPGITADPATDARTRALGTWLNEVDYRRSR